IIAVRLLVPFSIELPSAPVQMNVDMHEIVALSSQPVHTEQNTPILETPNKIDTSSDIVVNTTVNTTTPTDTIEQGILLDRGTVLFAIWLLGLLAFTIYHIVQYRRFYGKIMASAKPLEDSEELLERAGSDMGLQRYPAVLLSGKVQSPMLIGFRTPMIVLPYKLYGENELVMILRHELTHYKHHDLWYKLILLCANALHWFNPLVWMMNRQAGRDVEQVCDDYVVAGQDLDYRKAYSMTILNTMASQKGVALSTHLSKDAQNTKKRFAGILQPKTYKKGIAVFAAVLILAVGISGCLQIGKVDEGVALYNKVAEYLPENAIHEPEVYEVEEYPETGMTKYHWTEEPVYLYEKIYEAYSEAEPDNERHSYQWTNSAPEYYIYEQKGPQKIFRYKRDLIALVDKNGEVAHFEYWDKEKEDNYTGVFHGMDSGQALEYVENVADALIPRNEQVNIQQDYQFSTNSGRQSYMAYGKLNDYAIDIMMDGGYVQGFSRMPNKVYRQQVMDWLAAEETRLYRNYYNVLGNETTVFNEKVDGKYYIVELMHTMRHKNDGNPDDVPYIQELKETNPAEYQRHYDDYN
ncbi:MAG: M56 family metallopeptidase, partial [Peptococcaceae bacterium]|nr:M56 family metallopeptidase [Peptococcaceae bacterium]